MKDNLVVVLVSLIFLAAVVDAINFSDKKLSPNSKNMNTVKFSLVGDCHIENFYNYYLAQGGKPVYLNTGLTNQNVTKGDYSLHWKDNFGNEYKKNLSIWNDKQLGYDMLIDDIVLPTGSILVTDDFDKNAELIIIYNETFSYCVSAQYRIRSIYEDLVVEKIMERPDNGETLFNRYKVKSEFLNDLKEIEEHLFSYNSFDETNGVNETVEFIYFGESRIYRYGEGVALFFKKFEEALEKNMIDVEAVTFD